MLNVLAILLKKKIKNQPIDDIRQTLCRGALQTDGKVLKLQFIHVTLGHYKLPLALNALTSHVKHFLFLLWFERHIQILSYSNSYLCIRYSK